ncbi:MAG: TonB-dependent receptor, plug [Acidobacteriales bacterium]|nr:TonB-dependent receptor, plug [Terriglobales bacterium]
MLLLRRKSRCCRMCAVLLFCALTIELHGQSGPSDGQKDAVLLTHLSLEQLGNLEVVTASKEPEQIWRTAAAITVISQQEIRRSGVTSIPEALRLAPGVEVGRVSATTWAIGIRGLESNLSKSVLVLVDGRSVFTPFFSGVFWDQQDVVLEDIDRIEVIRGPGGTIWGPNAVNGVINIITKSAKDTHGTLVSIVAGDVDRVVAAARYGGGNSKGFDYRIFAKGFDRGPEFHPDNDNYDQWYQARGGFRMDWGSSERDNFTVQGDMYKGDSPRKAGIGSLNPPQVGQFLTADDQISGGDLLARWRRNLDNGSDIYLQAYFDRTIRTGLVYGEGRSTFDFDFLYRLKMGERNKVSVGAGLRWSPYSFEQTNQGVDILPHQATDHNHSAFLQDEIDLVPKRLSLTLGMKLEHNNFSGFDAQPTARVLWTPREHQTFWAAVTRAVTTPSRLEEGFNLQGVASVTPLIIVRVSGNPQFRSESLVGYEGGYRQLWGKSAYLDLAVFHNAYNNLQSFGSPVVTVEPTPAPPRTVLNIPYANDIAGATDGFEIAPTWSPLQRWRLAGSYSFVTTGLHASNGTSNISSTGSIQTYEGSTPRHQFEIRSYLTLPRSFEFDSTYRYYTSLPGQSLAGYQTADVRVGWNVRALQFSVTGQNLLQPSHYEWGTGDPNIPPVGIRRAIYGRVVWTSSR